MKQELPTTIFDLCETIPMNQTIYKNKKNRLQIFGGIRNGKKGFEVVIYHTTNYRNPEFASKKSIRKNELEQLWLHILNYKRIKKRHIIKLCPYLHKRDRGCLSSFYGIINYLFPGLFTNDSGLIYSNDDFFWQEGKLSNIEKNAPPIKRRNNIRRKPLKVNKVRGMDNVSTAVWFATLLLVYNKCHQNDNFGEAQTYFRQTDILEIATQMLPDNNLVGSTTISIYCNGDHYLNTCYFLRAKRGNIRRRLTAYGEFNGVKEKPEDLSRYESTLFKVNDEEIHESYKVSGRDLRRWYENIYSPLIYGNSVGEN